MILTKTFCAALKFAAHASAVKDVRYYLKGVLFEIKGDALHLVGTDGSRAAIASLRLEPAPAYDAVFIVTTESVKQLLTSFAKDKGEVTFQIAPAVAPDKPPILTIGAGVSIVPKVSDGVFPDWRRIVPPASRPNGAMPKIDAALVAQGCTAIQPMCETYKKTAGVSFSADGQDVVVIRPGRVFDDRLTDCIVIIAPMKE